MAYLKKRGKYYYAKWHTSKNGKKASVRKALGTRHKDVAQKMLKELTELELLGKIDPFASGFDPKEALKGDQPINNDSCATVREALDKFYSAKQHLSPATLDAYKRALDHFVELNRLEKESPKSIRPHHFENIIFKRGITAATRHYYFRHFRSWWKFLKKKKDFVFVYKGGTSDGLPVRGDRVYREFKRYAKVAGIPTTRSLHGMRHQAVTTWIEKGFHTAEASYMAGHSSQKVTEKYTHLTARNPSSDSILSPKRIFSLIRFKNSSLLISSSSSFSGNPLNNPHFLDPFVF